jgi:hypothetical protein
VETSKTPLYRRYGALLSQIELLTGIKRKSLHIALKRAKNIKSLRDLTRRELYEYILEIEVLFATEYGRELLGDEDETLTDELNKE